MAHRIRGAFELQGKFKGEVEMDEVYMGGLEKNKHKDKKLNAGQNVREMDTIDQMRHLVRQMPGKRLTYRRLKAPHPDGLSNHVRDAVALCKFRHPRYHTW